MEFVALAQGEDYLILPTGVYFSLDRPEFAARKRRYAMTMAIRAVALVLAAVFYKIVWLMIILAVMVLDMLTERLRHRLIGAENAR